MTGEGIDYQSPEFLDDRGNTRIRFLWDQTLDANQVNANEQAAEGLEPVSPPEGFFSGVEFTADRINAALASRRPEQIVPSRDTSGHGTAVAAVAAAGGRLLEGKYQGIAPESDLLVVKMGTPAPDAFPKTTELMKAVTYAVKKAMELGMPLAINLSFGNTYGSHDGTSLVERFLDNAAEIGRTVICAGSGNEGAAGGHVAGTFGRTAYDRQPQRIELAVGDYQKSFSVQLWKEYTDEIEIQLISPGGERVTLQSGAVGGSGYRMEETEVLIYQGEPSPYSVRQEIYFDFLPVANDRGQQAYINQGIWMFQLNPVKTVVGNYDFYLPSANVLNTGTRFFAPTPDKTLTIPSTAAKVITVGAYDAGRDAYADFSGRGYPLQNPSKGQWMTDSVKPDLAAPGVGIQTIGPGNTFVTVSGTSFAAPFVTGSAALMMEWGILRRNDPFLYGEKVKAYLRKGAMPIRGESIYPNDKVGWGALCVEGSLPG